MREAVINRSFLLAVFGSLLVTAGGLTYGQSPSVVSSEDPAFLTASASVIRVLNPSAPSESVSANFEFVLYDVVTGKDFPAAWGAPTVRLMKQSIQPNGRRNLVEVAGEDGKPLIERDEISHGHYRLFMEIARLPRPLATNYVMAISFTNAPKSGRYTLANPGLVPITFEERVNPTTRVALMPVKTFALPGRVEANLPARGKTLLLHCAREPAYSYRCYVPRSFDSRIRGIRVLIHSSPGGNARPLATEFAERTGWITVGLTESRNGDWNPIRCCRDAVIADLRERINPPFGSKWLVFAGFSGGGRASMYAGYQHSEETAGVLCMNAGIQASPGEPNFWNFPVAFIEGTDDMNANEVLGDCKSLTSAGKPYLLLRYTGGHTMPAPVKVTEALDWLAKQTPLMPAIPRVLARDPVQFKEETRFVLDSGHSSVRLETTDERGDMLAWTETKNRRERAVINGKPTPWYDEVQACRFSKNGLRSSYLARDGKRVMLFLDNRRVEMAHDASISVFSADGAHTVYAEDNFVKAGPQLSDHFESGYFGQGDIWIDGHKMTLPVSGTTYCRRWCISPDGRHVAFIVHQGKPDIAAKPELPEHEYLWLDGQLAGPYDRVESSLSFGPTNDCTFLTNTRGDVVRTMYLTVEHGSRIWIVNDRHLRFPEAIDIDNPYVTSTGSFQFYYIRAKPGGRVQDRIYFGGSRLNIPPGLLRDYNLTANGDLALMQVDGVSANLLEIYHAASLVQRVNIQGYTPDYLRIALSRDGEKLAFTAPVPVPNGKEDSKYPIVVVCSDYSSIVLDAITTMRFTSDGALLIVGQQGGKWYLFVDGYASRAYDEILDCYGGNTGKIMSTDHREADADYPLKDIFAYGIRQGRIFRIEVKHSQ